MTVVQRVGAARYVSWELAAGETRAWFQMRANDLRARFRAELVRNESTTASPTFTAREHEGQGLVVVSLVVAGKTPITPPTAAFDARSLSAAITAALSRPPGQTQALELGKCPACGAPV